MALDLTDRYDGQVTAGDASYPYGKARNVTVEGDGTGTPYEQDLVNDLLGFLQGLLVASDLEPSGSPDTALVSQYLQAVGWVAEASHRFFNVKHPTYGAVGDGVADDHGAVQDAITACAAAGGGTVLLPPGRYRLTAELAVPPNVHFYGIPGTVQLAIDNATARTVNFAGTWETQTQFFGIDFEGEQANTGTVMFAGTSVGLDVKLTLCRGNIEDTNLSGRFWQTGEIADTWTAEDCTFVAVRTTIPFSVTNYHLIRGRYTMAPGATQTLFPVGSSGKVQGSTFVQVSTGGNVSFLSVGGGGVLECSGALADVDDSGAGASTYFIHSNGGRIYTNGNRMRNDAIYYRYGAIAAENSDMELLPNQVVSVTDPAATVSRQRRSTLINVNDPAVPTITVEDPLYDGQPMDLMIKNANGGAWSGPVVFSGPIAYTPLINDLGAGSLASLHMVAASGAWTPVGAVGTYAP